MIKFDYIITNGYIDINTIQNKTKDGWKFVTTLPALLIHPHAMETDKVTIFSKYSADFKKIEDIETIQQDIQK